MDKKVADLMNEILSNAPKNKYKAVNEDCEWLQNDEKRFCKTTSQKQCGKCQFYSPKYSAKVRLVVERILDERKKADRERSQLQKYYQEQLDDLRAAVTFYRTCGTA